MIDAIKNYFDRMATSADQKAVIINLPNAVTMLRVCIIPVLFFLLFNPGRFWSFIIAILFIMAALTDLLDGYLARRYHIVTNIGKFLDPIADKIIVNTAMIVLIPIGRIPACIVAIIIIRDFIVDGIRTIATSEGMIIDASKIGKRKMLCQIFAVSALIIHYPLMGANAHIVGTVVLYVALWLTLHSGCDYLLKFYRYANKR